MPLIRRTNNRTGPSNDRVADVARESIERVLDVETRRYANAFYVHGYNGVLYRTKERGLSCACTGLNRIASHQLDPDGKIQKGMIDSLLLNTSFGVRSYGTRNAPTEEMADNLGISRYDMPRKIIHDQHPALQRPTGSYQDHYGNDNIDPRVKTLVPDGEGPNGPVIAGNDPLLEEIVDDLSADPLGNTAVACPICFGTGYIGGYDIMNGYRAVYSSGTSELEVNGLLSASESNQIPTFSARSFVLRNVLLPRDVFQVDAFKVWNYDTVVPASFIVDNVSLHREEDIIGLCDGRSTHTIQVNFVREAVAFTHFEVQFNQSETWPLFEFPKVTKNANQNLLESMDPFTINMSPRIPQISAKDVITESTYGKALLVGQVMPWNTRRRDVLGWDAEVRVVQPQELYNLLPRRMRLEKQRTPPHVRDNSFGRFRT